MYPEFALKFYSSGKWKKCRNTIFNRDNGICQVCGSVGTEIHHKISLTPLNINDPYITLNPSNLITICHECHEKETQKNRENGRALYRKNKKVTDGCYFDENGELIKSNVHIVYGSPASGKTTFVREEKEDGDLVIDLDLIRQALSMESKSNAPSSLVHISIKVRDYLYELIEHKQYDCHNVWIVATLPLKKEREYLKERLKAELIFMESDINTCMDRAFEDDERKDKSLQSKIIEKWFKDYQR